MADFMDRMSTPPGGWDAYRMAVLGEIQRMNEELQRLQKEIAATRREFHTEITSLKLMVSTMEAKNRFAGTLWGMIGGAAVTAIIAFIVQRILSNG